MLYGLYAMRDVKTGFMTPVMDQSDDSAIRNFCHTIAKSDGILSSFAQDFSLFHIADYDSDTGSVVPLVPVVQLVDGPFALRSMERRDTDA